MKVAILSFHFLESTIPLAKNLALKGIKVDLFCLMSQGNQNSFVFDLKNNKQANGFVNSNIIKSILSESLNEYISDINTKIFIYPNRRLQTYLLGDLYYALKLAKYINKHNYDIIHIIPHSGRFSLFLYLLLKTNKLIFTLHEVTAHESKTSFLEKFKLSWMVKNSIPTIFHSNISKKRFTEFRNTVTTKKSSKEMLAMIRFGLFDTYLSFKNPTSIIAHSRRKINILYFGRIVPYKGINFLIEAVNLLQDTYPIHLVVAGTGIPYFDFKEIHDFEFINRYISNEEIVEFIEKCDMVVLPYTSASQSGIPMTVFPFNKPVIASNIEGFEEVIDHLETGILVDKIDGKSFAAAIEMLLKNKDLQNTMVTNIKNKYNQGEFSWASIADKTLTFYQKRLKNQ